VDANLSGSLATPLGSVPSARSDLINGSVTGFGDLIPMVSLRWNAGVHNYMTYITGDVPVGNYDASRLVNLGIGHGAIDGGFGYTYFDQKTGHEISGVLGFTYNTVNPITQYQSGVDLHFDWGASQFLTKQLQVGVVGYIYDEVGCDSGFGDRVGCFQSRVVGIGPTLQHRGRNPGADVVDVRQLGPRRMRQCVVHELREIGMGEKRTNGIEDPDDAMLAGPLLLDKIAEAIELEIGGQHTVHLAL